MAESGKSAKSGKSGKGSAPKQRRDDPVDEDDAPASRTWAILAAVVVVAVAVVLILANRSGTAADPSPTGSATKATGEAPSSAGNPSSSVSVDPAQASACGLTAIAMSGTVSQAPQATWSMIGAIAAPSIAGQGPGEKDEDGYPSCFARTPTGALLAASTYVAMGSYDPWRRKYYERAMVPGRGQEVLLSKPVETGSPNGIQVQISGFYVVSYDGQKAEIDIGLSASDGSEGAKLVSLQWSEGDWKVRLNDDGTELSPLREKHPDDQFIPWSAGL